MFDKEYSFRGKHAEFVTKLTSILDNDTKVKIFERNVDVYIMAPIVGFLYNRTANIDKSNDKNTKIFTDTLIKESFTLDFNYKLIMLLALKDKFSEKERINRTFRGGLSESEIKESDELYNRFVLGGVEVLYEKIIRGSIHVEDYIKNLYEFLTEFNERYNDSIDNDSIYNLCMAVRE